MPSLQEMTREYVELNTAINRGSAQLKEQRKQLKSLGGSLLEEMKTQNKAEVTHGDTTITYTSHLLVK